MIRLLAVDIDGTLLDSKGRVPEDNIRALARAGEAGVGIALATGRRSDFAAPTREAVPCRLTWLHATGAIVRRRVGATLVRHPLPRAIARDLLARVAHCRDGAAVTFDRPGAQVVFEAIDWEHPRHRGFF